MVGMIRQNKSGLMGEAVVIKACIYHRIAKSTEHPEMLVREGGGQWRLQSARTAE